MSDGGRGDGLERIWTPHRMAYVRTAVDDEGCPFCAIPGHPDERPRSEVGDDEELED